MDSSLLQKLSCEPADRAKQLFARERLRHIPVGALLLSPKLLPHRFLGGHHNHRNGVKFGAPLQVAADLKSISIRHYDIKQVDAGSVAPIAIHRQPLMAQSHPPFPSPFLPPSLRS